MKKLFFLVLAPLLLVSLGKAQIPTTVLVRIVKAEDSRSFDKTIENLLRSPNAKIRERAALAAGRIGREEALPAIIDLLSKDISNQVRAMAAFAVGEIESVKGADTILQLVSTSLPSGGKNEEAVIARAVEAAGKIVAAHPKDPKATELGNAIISVLEFETSRGIDQNREIVLLALTAALRARPDKADLAVAKYLVNADARIRSDAGNTLARLRAKNANETLRKMLDSDADAVARANAARALGAAEDKDAFALLLNAATTDVDSRVRVSAIRAVASLNDARAADRLIERGEKLFADYKNAKKANFIPSEQSEFLEIATALGRVLANSENDRAVNLLRSFGILDKGFTTEVYVAMTRIRQSRGDGKKTPEMENWHQISTLAQMVGEFAIIEPKSETGKQMKAEAPAVVRPLARAFAEADPESEGKRMYAGPDALQAFARFKTDDLGEVARLALQNKDVQMRAAAAGILADLPSSNENTSALHYALDRALKLDKKENDAQLAILDALVKLAGRESISEVSKAIYAPDYLVRKKALDLLQQFPDWSDTPVSGTARAKLVTLQPYDPKAGTKLGQVLNTDADYYRAVTRKNGGVKAVLRTEKGTFTIDFLPEEAPLTVDNFVKLARSGYFNGLEVHRVVSNFVMQDGDPRGDGNGGPGWSIRCEVNMHSYDRGAVGMALSGKDTGGSQWFVTHSPQPHLDGGYTVFGHVSEADMKVVDNIVRGDRIIAVKVVERITSRTRKR